MYNIFTESLLKIECEKITSIIFKVKTTGSRFAEDCETVKSKTVKNFIFKMTWQNGKYTYSDSGAELKRLRREEKRFGFDNNQ